MKIFIYLIIFRKQNIVIKRINITCPAANLKWNFMHLYVGLINNRTVVDSGYLIFDYSVLNLTTTSLFSLPHLLSPFYRWGNWHMEVEELNLLIVIQANKCIMCVFIIKDGDRTQIPKHIHNHHLYCLCMYSRLRAFVYHLACLPVNFNGVRVSREIILGCPWD